jgi:hypothetical protein
MRVFSLMTRWAGLAAASAALVAWGGGGDDGASAAPPIAARMTISAATAPPMSAEALQAIGAGSSAAGGVAGQTDPTSAAPKGLLAFKSAARALQRLKVTDRPSQATSARTFSCAGGGTFTVTVTLAGASLQAGDTIRIDFSSCVEAGVTTVGGLSMAIVAIGGTDAAPLLTADVLSANFEATIAGVTERTNGTMRITVDQTNPATTLVALSSANITTQRLRSGTVRATRTLANLAVRESLNTATGQTTTTAAFIASGTFPRLAEGSFEVQTPQPIIQDGGAVRPRSGQIRIIGANNASVLATVLATGMQLEIDSDGNGTVDTTRTLTWAEIDAQLDT